VCGSTSCTEPRPERSLRANPGTLFEWHDDRDESDNGHGGEGALYVKEHGSGDTGWVEVATRPGQTRPVDSDYS
jgi:hypothetical protein